MKGIYIRPRWVCSECHAKIEASGFEVQDSHPVATGWRRVWRGFRGWDWICDRCSLSPRRKAKKVTEECLTLCTCSHIYGNHYTRSGWPACSECTECKAFEAVEDTNVTSV